MRESYGKGSHIRVLAAACALTLVASGVVLASASADTAPPAGVPTTVSADPLPTWQLNGVVWSQAIVGTTVYVAGKFTKARPPGVAPGGSGEVAANNAFAYDITTGNRVTSFHPQLDAQSNVVAASPDGSRVYFGGDFSTVDGQGRSHIAAFDTATNTLSSAFRPVLSSRVTALTVSATSVYAGGWFDSAQGVARKNLAAFAVSDGSLRAWAPVPDDTIMSMVLAPDGSRVIVGGRFLHLNGVAAYGMGAVDSAAGTTTLPWAANTLIRNATSIGGITSLRTDGVAIYGSGYVYGAWGANFEGTFSAEPLTGKIRWLNDCRGDTYDVAPIGSVMYVASHEHTCQWIGAFSETTPTTYRRATAFTTYATGMNTGPDSWDIDFSSKACGTLLNWFPDLAAGTFTGQYQAAWSVTGNGSYVSFGGEFPTVNGVAQQGLVRFAAPGIAPNKVGPVRSSVLAPSGTSPSSGTIAVRWPSAWDMDNQYLTYRLFRDAGTTPVTTVTAPSTFWSLPTLSFTDSGLVGGSTHTYRLTVTDPFGNQVSGPTSASILVSSTAPPPPPPPAPGPTVYAQDSFTRTVATGWGSADLGGSWTAASSTPWSVANGVGSMVLAAPGASPSIYLGSVSQSSMDLALTLSSNKAATGSGVYVNVVGRRVSGVGDLRAKVRLTSAGTVGLTLVRVGSGGAETALVPEVAVAGVTWAAGTKLRVRLQVTGANPTTVRARVWRVGTTEPTTWTASTTTTATGLQVAGAIGLVGYLAGGATNSPVVVSVDDLAAVSAG